MSDTTAKTAEVKVNGVDAASTEHGAAPSPAAAKPTETKAPEVNGSHKQAPASGVGDTETKTPKNDAGDKPSPAPAPTPTAASATPILTDISEPATASTSEPKTDPDVTVPPNSELTPPAAAGEQSTTTPTTTTTPVPTSESKTSDSQEGTVSGTSGSEKNSQAELQKPVPATTAAVSDPAPTSSTIESTGSSAPPPIAETTAKTEKDAPAPVAMEVEKSSTAEPTTTANDEAKGAQTEAGQPIESDVGKKNKEPPAEPDSTPAPKKTKTDNGASTNGISSPTTQDKSEPEASTTKRDDAPSNENKPPEDTKDNGKVASPTAESPKATTTAEAAPPVQTEAPAS